MYTLSWKVYGNNLIWRHPFLNCKKHCISHLLKICKLTWCVHVSWVHTTMGNNYVEIFIAEVHMNILKKTWLYWELSFIIFQPNSIWIIWLQYIFFCGSHCIIALSCPKTMFTCGVWNTPYKSCSVSPIYVW